jgi:hypothetical protein
MRVRPEFEPTLPALVRRRTGLPERTTVALLVLGLVLLAVAVLLVRPRVDGTTQLVHRGEPTFNLLYANDALAEAEPRPGELARLEGRRGRQTLTITVRPLELPPYEGDVVHGLLPAYASGHIRELRARLERFRLRDEHRARINRTPGYEIEFRAGPRDRRVRGTDTLIVPDEEESRGALVLSMRREVEGRRARSADEKAFSRLAAKAYRSFYYGTEQD